MITLGPYVIFSGSKATKWSYFKFDPNNPEQPASYYTAPYAETNTEIKWTQSPLANKTPIYLYDIAENTPRCYVMDTGILYDVPLQSLNGKPLVNAMRQITLKNHEITHQMARKRAREYGVTTNQYPHPGNFSTNIPALPITEPVIATAEVSHPSVSSGGAKKTLEVTQCIQVETEADCPTEIAKGCMYVWKKGDQWSFKTNFLESIKTGIFDTQLDKDVITTLNTQPLGDITSEISSIRHDLNRPYLNLTPYQQAILVAAMSLDWPLNDKLSSDEQIQACHAIIEGGPLPESIANNEKLNSDINAFRPYLFPSTINNLYENNPHFTSKPAPTIADIVLFTDYLLIGAAQTLGDKLPININPPPKSSEVMCGQLEDVSNQSRLLYQGLSEGQSELFQLIMNAQMQGLEAMPVEQLVRLPALLYAVMEPSGEGHELIELSSDLIASIAAQQNILQEEAKKKLKETCGNMIRQANKIARRKLISLLQEEALALNPNETLKVLAEWFFKSDNLTQANRDAVTQHQNPESVADALITLHQAGLLKGEAAQANLDTVIQHQNPYKVADALITLHQAGLLKGEAAQANRNAITQHQDLKDVTYALKMLHHEGPLQDEAAQANFNAVVQHQDPWMVADALITLHQANLLKGEAAQANREAITQHQNPESVAGALIILHQADLLKGEAAQANFNAVVQHQDPCKVADALIILHQAGLLTGEAAQANREALAQHEDPMSFANELIMRHETETLADNTTQTNHNAASQKQLKEDLNNLKPSSKPEQNEGPEAELNARKP